VKRALLLGFLLLVVFAGKAGAATSPRVLVIHFGSDLEIDPVTQGWLDSQLHRANDGSYSAVVIELDTPGGDEDSMRTIVQHELASKVPVIVYVADGGRAGSAGVWVSEAADVLAMGPDGTEIGASTPIESTGQNVSGSDLRRKVINDAAASLESLMQSHHRDAAWGNKAVRVASSLTAQEALKMNVIDLVSPSLPALLNTIDGRVTVPRHFTLHTANAQIVNSSPGFVTKFLDTLINPNVVSLLFLAGIIGIGFEIFHPGAILPGTVGAIAMVAALFGLSILSVSWSGVALIIVGLALLVIDAHVPTHGVLTVGGLIALAVGLSTFVNGSSEGTGNVSVPLIVTLAVVLGASWALAISKAIRARRMPVEVGPEEIVGMRGVVRDDGHVFVHGELWRARSVEPLEPGQPVEVDALDGLTLQVHPV
jgi:membrane-bound serine protease (ClpP class)